MLVIELGISGKIIALCYSIYISLYNVSRAFALATPLKYQQKLSLFADFYHKRFHWIMQDVESQKQNWKEKRK